MISHFLAPKKCIVPIISVINLNESFFGAGKVQNPLFSVFHKIDHKKSSIIVTYLWFLLNGAEWAKDYFKRNQRYVALLELFLWPILGKTEKRGFWTFPAPKKNSFKFITEIIGTIHFFWAKKWDITRLDSYFHYWDKAVASSSPWAILT